MIQSPVYTPPNLELRKRRRHFKRFQEMLGPRAFARRSDRSDAEFFSNGGARSTLLQSERDVSAHLLASLITNERPSVLELVSGGQTLLPRSVEPSRLVGLGPALAPLEHNQRLTERLVHDLGTDAALPLEDNAFDLVVNAFSVPYLLRADRLFDEVGRILRPGGILAVLYDDDFVADHAIRYWAAADEDERMMLVEDYIGQSRHFNRPRIFVHPAPSGSPEESPVYLVYAEKRGAPAPRQRPRLDVRVNDIFPPEEVERRKQRVAQTHECPYCGEKLSDVEVTPSPWGGWDTDHVYVCLNEDCPWQQRSIGVLFRQGIRRHNYRTLFHPDTGQLITLPSPMDGGKLLPRRLTKDH